MSNPISVFVGGAQKSGTRSVSQYFRTHPLLAVHKKKEGHFFDQDDHFTDDIPTSTALKTYQGDFDVNSDTKYLCDITPDYIYRQAAVKRIHHHNPDAIWIVLLRNPIDRAYSAWNMEVNRQAENLPFEQALVSELNGHSEQRSHDRFHYIARSQYHAQIKNLWDYFPQHQCQIYSAESVWQQPQMMLNKILGAINLEPLAGDAYEHVHKGAYQYELSDQARSLLADHLHYELTELPALLGWDENPWTPN